MTIAPASPLDMFRRFRVLVYLLVLLSVAGFAHAENSSTIFVACLAAAALSWVLVESRPKSAGLPRGLVNAGVLAVSAGLIGEELLEVQPNLLLSLGHFITGILICKLFEKKSVWDYAQILALTLMVMVAGAIFSASLSFAIILLAYLGIGFYTILLLHLHAESERAAREGSGSHLFGQTLTPHALLMRRDVRRVAVLSSFFLVAVASVVFLFLPRTRGQGLFAANWSSDGTIRTGYSEHVRFSDYGQLQQSDAVVMEVKIEEDGANVGSDAYEPYFRGAALENYDLEERQWSRSNEETGVTDALVFAGTSVPLMPPAFYNTIGMFDEHYTMHAYTGNALFTIAPAVTFSADREVSILYNPRDFSLSMQNPSPQPLHYSTTSAVIYKSDIAVPALLKIPGNLGYTNRYDGSTPRRNMVPPQIRQLAQKLVADLVPAGNLPTLEQIRPIADRYAEYLRSTYPYSLRFEMKDPTLDPTADFLLNRKKTGGHCEYFASAMVMLCRSVGLNARMVTGYHGGDFNSISGLYVVRQKDAHAWAEVYVPSRGWALYDPSPIATYSEPPSIIAKWLRDFSDIVQKGWQSTIIAFDNSSQTYIFSVLSNLFSGAVMDARSSVAQIWDGLKDIFLNSANTPYAPVACAFAIVLVLGLVLWLFIHLKRRRNSQLQYILRKVDRKVQRQLAHELAFFDELLRLLARTGERKRIHQTPREYVEALSPALGGATGDARWLIGTFYDVRFGTLRMTSTMRTQIAAALRRVRDQLQTGTGAQR